MNNIAITAINKFFYFSMNYPHDFIEKVWGEDKPYSLTHHLKEKFDGLYEQVGCYGVMNAFYADLDTSNRVKLMEWVMDNYHEDIKIPYGNL